MKYLLLVAILPFATIAYSQKVIKLEDLSKHVGDTVKVCGKVYGIRYLEQAKNSPTLINIGGAYPNQKLTIVIFGTVRKTFEKTPEELFADKEVCVTGKVELYKGKEQIVIASKEYIGEQ